MIEYTAEALKTPVKLTFPGSKVTADKYALRPFARKEDHEFEVIFREKTAASSSKTSRQALHERSLHGFRLDNKCRFVFDPESLKTICYFERGVSADRLIGQSLNRSVLAYQSSLGMLFVHSASIISRGKVFLFLAPSGGGKTTLSAIARKLGFKVVSEEVCAVKMKNGRFYAGDFPCFTPKVAGYGYTEVGGLYFLAKSKKTFVEKMSFKEAMSMALPETLYFSRPDIPRSDRMPHRKRVFGLLNELFLKFPAERLSFARNEGALECLK